MYKFKRCPKLFSSHSFFLDCIIYYLYNDNCPIPSLAHSSFELLCEYLTGSSNSLCSKLTHSLPPIPFFSSVAHFSDGDAIHKDAEIRHLKGGDIFYFNFNSSSITKTYPISPLSHKSSIFIHFHCHSPSPKHLFRTNAAASNLAASHTGLFSRVLLFFQCSFEVYIELYFPNI